MIYDLTKEAFNLCDIRYTVRLLANTYGFPPGPILPLAVTPFVGGGPGGLGAASGS